MRLQRLSIRWRWAVALALLALAAVLSGCGTIGFYGQAVRGQIQLLRRQQSCEKLLASATTPPELKAKLELARQVCEFAERELQLPANGHYRSYADLQRRYAVWNVYAAPTLSIEPKTWWYPIVGRLEYRGYFVERAARRYANALARRGLDVYVEGAETYSTLGWFKDPLLNTFIRQRPAALAEVLFHELAHQRVFAAGDTEFSEAFATAVGQEGVRRWLRSEGQTVALEQYLTALRRQRQIVQLVQDTRRKLRELYNAEATPGRAKQAAPSRHELLQSKQRLLDQLRRDYEKLKQEWDGYAGYDDWFAGGLNNAQLNAVATYYDLVPAFERLLAAQAGDLEKLYAAVSQLAKLPKAQRHRRLLE